jgi:3-oxoacyl-[acyl-carrier protein] reductase
MDPDGKVALVTGAASGIGRASARLLAARGAFVVVADVDDEGGAETVSSIEQAGGFASFVHLDVSRAEDFAHVFDAIVAEHGAIHIVHNNAGLVSGAPDFPDTAPERIAAVVGVNVGGAFVGTRLAITAMSRTGGGVVVNMSSLLADASVDNTRGTADPVYSATKAAVKMLTQLCAPYAASHGVRVNALLPGGVDTPILRKTGDGSEPAAWLKPRLEEIELLTPEQLAEAVLALVEDDSRAGETVVVPNAEPVP